MKTFVITASTDADGTSEVKLIKRELQTSRDGGGMLETTLGRFPNISKALQEVAYISDELYLDKYLVKVEDNRR